MEMISRRLLKNARALRASLTDAEQRLWYQLRGHRLLGLKFRRQSPIGPYIVDFICKQRMLIIELDGGQHSAQVEYDQQRTRWLERQGYRVVRFWDHEVMQQMEAVLERLYTLLKDPLPPTPLPPAGEGNEAIGYCRDEAVI